MKDQPRVRAGIIARLVDPGIIAVIRTSQPDQVAAICEALLKGGVVALEITLTIPRAIQAIREASQRFGARALVGAGTVLNASDCRGALDAGADFIVTPISKLEVLREAHAADRPVMLGAYTPT